ncbi:hypothetical protein GCM10010121_019000 [Streptomyces brasiliensis]|uniref:PH domain-containing protein n=1 Tax=Streptomyces brasiliensis TaxID=1954 RepID=A0A917NMD9_9ACTN|nr:hypothetical protein GCM10010121_019000 [Streptomyces brasiliensis]
MRLLSAETSREDREEWAAAFWLQLQEVPFAPVGDAAGEPDTTEGWSPAPAQGYTTDRVMARIALHALTCTTRFSRST